MGITPEEIKQALDEVTEMTSKLNLLTDNDNLGRIAQQLKSVQTNNTLGENLTFDQGLDIAERAIKNFTPADTPEIEQWLERLLKLSRILSQLKRNPDNE